MSYELVWITRVRLVFSTYSVPHSALIPFSQHGKRVAKKEYYVARSVWLNGKASEFN
jgi:hypothetical protein